MTIKEANVFYNQDAKKYILAKNKEFLNWYKDEINNGYNAFIEIEDLQNMINKIVNWYEIKYPEREMEYNDGVWDPRFSYDNNLSSILDFNQLMYRLSHYALCLIECGYRSRSKISIPICNNDGELIKFEDSVILVIRNNHFVSKCHSWYSITDYPQFTLYMNSETGLVKIKDDLKPFIKEDFIHIEKALEIFKEKFQDKFDFSELKQVIYNHKIDLVLRKKILELIALNLLYSRTTIPEYGYLRARSFIGEFNKNIQGLNLETKEIDDIMKKDYSVDFENAIVSNDYNKKRVLSKIFKK